MRDIDIRKKLNYVLEKRYNINNSYSLLIDEFSLCQGDARIDVAVINGRIHGYEIKSEQDNLDRLPSQLLTYSKIFDHLTIVTNEKHLTELKNILPYWCGITVAIGKKDKIILKELRKAKDNPHIDSFSLTQLLWKDEVISLLKELGYKQGIKNKPRVILWKKLAESMSLQEVRKQVRTTIKKRGDWRVGLGQKSNGVLLQSIAR